MPISVEFKAENIGLLRQAAAKLGLVVLDFSARLGVLTINKKDGSLVATVKDGQATCTTVMLPLVNKLRVQYRVAARPGVVRAE